MREELLGSSRSPALLVLAVALLALDPKPATGQVATTPDQFDPQATGRPNVVIVVADDVGFTDLGAYGSEIRTPNIDRLAREGVQFTNFHASPMCSPSRAMLLTGVDAHTAGVGSLYEATPLRQRGKRGYEGHLREDVVTLATRLSRAGYRTYLSGKWNLGHTPQTLPSVRGFDRTFALDATGADNYEKRSYLPIYDEPPWFADGEPTDLPDDFYSSEFLVDKMIEFIDEDHRRAEEASERQPFFAYLAFQAIHIPVQAPREFIERYLGVYDGGWEELRRARFERAVAAGIVSPETRAAAQPPQDSWSDLERSERALAAKRMAVNAAMLEAMDFHLGRLIAYLEAEGQRENTFFVVLSDNGPEAGDPMSSAGFRRWLRSVGYRTDFETLGEKGSYVAIGPHFAAASAAPLAYYKFHGGEGGVRVPLIMAGAGVRAHGLAGGFSFITDIAPTVLEVAGVDAVEAAGMQPVIGRSLVPVLSDPAARVYGTNDAVGFETAGHSGVWKGDYKLVRVGPPAGDRVWRLFNLSRDPGETEDLANIEPQRFAKLMADYEAYAERVGVLEVPAGYSPDRQLGINMAYDRLRRHLLVLTIVAATAMLVGLGWLRSRRRRRVLTLAASAQRGFPSFSEPSRDRSSDSVP